MSNFGASLWVELLKARRTRIPLLTLGAFSLAPFVDGFFMIVIKDPEAARRLGIISTKAQIVAGTADWPTYLGVMAQAVAIGGVILFSFINSWVFGREYSDRTVKDLLALPTPRSTIVLAKFVLVGLWSAGLAAVIMLIGMLVGSTVGLPPAPGRVILQGVLTIVGVTLLTITLGPPIAFIASAGRGYLAPMGTAILAVMLAQIIAAAGWGHFFPWSVPALYAGMAGPELAQMGSVSYALVYLTGLGGMAATFYYWQRADQTY